MASVINRINLYFKNLYLDYSEVFREIHKGARRRPLKASLYGASTLIVLNLFRTNEGLRSYSNEVVSACDRLGAVTDSCRNPISRKFVQDIGELHCHGLLRQVDLGFSTLIYKVDTNPDVALYKYNCKYMRPSIKEFITERLVDFGIQGHWLMLELKMHDYDINETEYDNLNAEEKPLGLAHQ